MSWEVGQAINYLGNFSILETLLLSNGVPVHIGLVAGVLDNGEEEHGLRGSGLFLWSFVGHCEFLVVLVSPCQ